MIESHLSANLRTWLHTNVLSSHKWDGVANSYSQEPPKGLPRTKFLSTSNSKQSMLRHYYHRSNSHYWQHLSHDRLQSPREAILVNLARDASLILVDKAGKLSQCRLCELAMNWSHEHSPDHNQLGLLETYRWWKPLWNQHYLCPAQSLTK